MSPGSPGVLVARTTGTRSVDETATEASGRRAPPAAPRTRCIDETLQRVAGELRLNIESTIRDRGPWALAPDPAALAAVDLIQATA